MEWTAKKAAGRAQGTPGRLLARQEKASFHAFEAASQCLLSEVAKHLFRYFYARIGVPEVWVIDRDTRRPQLYVLAGAGYEEQARDPEGRLTSKLGVLLGVEPDQKLVVQIAGDPSTRRSLP